LDCTSLTDKFGGSDFSLFSASGLKSIVAGHFYHQSTDFAVAVPVVNDLRKPVHNISYRFIGVSDMERDMVSECITSIAVSVGRIVGFRLATNLIYEPLERTRSMYKEVREVKIYENSIVIVMDSRVPEKRLMEIMKTFLSGINEQYSKVIGRVSSTLIKKSLESCASKYGNGYPDLKGLLKDY
jgi:hypothetical protein